MIELIDDKIEIDGKAQLLLCGEIHYFRLPQDQWEDRIIRLKETGCNTVASYIPWLCHEPEQGRFHFEGKLDLAHFISLCEKHELFFIPRPGPFIMAEIKNEGIPYWVYEQYPEIIPVGWDNQPATTPTVDYLASNFLAAARAWYQALAKILVPHLVENGGTIVAMQLDNEIGMLSWVSNVPDLTDQMIKRFGVWLTNKYGDQLEARYPVSLEMLTQTSWVRSPKEEYAGALRTDLGEFLRFRYKEYVRLLKEYAIDARLVNIPYIINIHGTGGGRGLTYPIGISQLYESYTQAADFLPGSDIYFGDFTMEMFQDLYLANCFMKAVNRKGQPISSMEFNCGDGNFGDNYGGRLDISAADLKGRLCIAQSNRLINYYLFTGGYNDEMANKRKDGNNRIAITGERHGFAAPIDPEGYENYTFDRMKQSLQTFATNADHLAEMTEELDSVSFGFIPDYYMTEFAYPTSEIMKRINQNLERFRGPSAWEIVARSLLLANYRFGSIDVQNKKLDQLDTPVLILPLAEYLSEKIQGKLVEYIQNGGKLFIYGNLPRFDETGKPCTLLMDALNIQFDEHLYDGQGYSLSVVGVGWAANTPETRTSHAQTFSVEVGEIFLVEKETQNACGAQLALGKGEVIFLTSDYRGDKEFFTEILARFQTTPLLTHDYPYHGIVMTSSISSYGRTIHLMNLDGFTKTFTIFQRNQALFNQEKICLGAKRGLIVPLDYETTVGKIIYATGEIFKQTADSLIIRGFGKRVTIVLETTKELLEMEDIYSQRENGKLRIDAGLVEETVCLSFKD